MAAGPGVCRPQADELHGSLREFEREKDQSGEQVDDTVLQRARQHGRIVWFNHHKYYGFIATSKHKDVFVHSSDFEGCDPEILKPGMPVEFDLGSRPKGPCALRVRIREMVD